MDVYHPSEKLIKEYEDYEKLTGMNETERIKKQNKKNEQRNKRTIKRDLQAVPLYTRWLQETILFSRLVILLPNGIMKKIKTTSEQLAIDGTRT